MTAKKFPLDEKIAVDGLNRKVGSKIQQKINTSQNISHVITAEQYIHDKAAPLSLLNSEFAKFWSTYQIPMHDDPDRALKHERYYEILRACTPYLRANHVQYLKWQV